MQVNRKELVEALVRRDRPDEADRLMEKFEKEGLISSSDERTVFVPDGFSTDSNGRIFGDLIEALENTTDCYDRNATDRFIEMAEDICRKNPKTQDERVALLKEISEFDADFGKRNLPSSPPSYILNYETADVIHRLGLNEDMKKVAEKHRQDMIKNCLTVEEREKLTAAYQKSSWAREGEAPADDRLLTLKLDQMKNSVDMIKAQTVSDLLADLSRDTQGVTHDEISRNFDEYQIKDLDSVQFIARSNPHPLLSQEIGGKIQLTISAGNTFNAMCVSVPVSEFDYADTMRYMAAAAKYSQTQDEFEKETSLKYNEVYAPDADNRYCSAGFEILGDARYDEDIQQTVDDALGRDDLSGLSDIDAGIVYATAEKAGYSLAADPPEVETNSRTYSEEEWDSNCYKKTQ